MTYQAKSVDFRERKPDRLPVGDSGGEIDLEGSLCAALHEAAIREVKAGGVRENGVGLKLRPGREARGVSRGARPEQAPRTHHAASTSTRRRQSQSYLSLISKSVLHACPVSGAAFLRIPSSQTATATESSDTVQVFSFPSSLCAVVESMSAKTLEWPMSSAASTLKLLPSHETSVKSRCASGSDGRVSEFPADAMLRFESVRASREGDEQDSSERGVGKRQRRGARAQPRAPRPSCNSTQEAVEASRPSRGHARSVPTSTHAAAVNRGTTWGQCKSRRNNDKEGSGS